MLQKGHARRRASVRSLMADAPVTMPMSDTSAPPACRAADAAASEGDISGNGTCHGRAVQRVPVAGHTPLQRPSTQRIAAGHRGARTLASRRVIQGTGQSSAASASAASRWATSSRSPAASVPGGRGSACMAAGLGGTAACAAPITPLCYHDSQD